MTCGIRNDFSTDNGFCQNGHDNWLEYRDVFLMEDASDIPLKQAMIIFDKTKEELRKDFKDTSIKQFTIVKNDFIWASLECKIPFSKAKR